MSFLDAAEQVLLQFGAGTPMHYRETTKKARDLGLIATTGLTPEATMYSQMLTEIRRKAQRGEMPCFAMHGKGKFGLARWVKTDLAAQIEHHNREVRKKLLERLRAMPPSEFEALIGRLLGAIGFENVELTPASADGGIDVRGVLVVGGVIRTRMAIQVKRWKHNVHTPIVQQVRGSLGTHDQGLIITTGDFSVGSRQEAQQPNKIPVALMNGEQLVDLLVENNIGVRRTTHDLIELAEGDDEI